MKKRCKARIKNMIDYMLTPLSENEIIVTLIALALLLGSAYIFGSIFELVKAPRVVGEIVGGIFLGGSCLHALFPQFISNIFLFYQGEGKVLNIFYQLGLIFLMFLSGYNTKLDIQKKNIRTAGCLLIGSTVIPMLLAIPFISIFKPHFIWGSINDISFDLVFIIGVAITSIPVISKIFFDMGIMNTKFSNLVLTVATFQDLCLWILLNTATRIVTTGEVKVIELILVVAITIGLFIAVKLVSEHIPAVTGEIRTISFYTISFMALLLICALFSVIGINIMYSAFLVGYVVKALAQSAQDTSERITSLGDFVFSFFVPIYFALVGIQLNLLNSFSVERFVLFFLVAFGLEAVGTYGFLLFTNLNNKTRINLSITMNARGGPGIVLATVAYSYRIISLEFFSVLILTTMLSSVIAGYWLRSQQKMDDSIFMNLER